MAENSKPSASEPHSIDPVLLSPPFVQIEGVFNIRDFGAGRPVSENTAIIKPFYLFRSGELTNVTDKGAEQLKALGIQKVFDLRVDEEIMKYRSAGKVIDGIEIVRAPIIQDGWGPHQIAAKLKGFEENELEAFLKTYKEIFTCGTASLVRVLLHLRDRPDMPVLIHCTAGKDRTGVFAAVILLLLGAREEDIVADYTLTEIGMKPLLPILALRLQKDAVFRENWTGTLNLGSAKPQAMQGFLDYLRNEHGGIEEYLISHTSLTENDLERIRENLLI
ncbi:protein-tyrosine phosphatase-like protein [Trametes meyenii]|nr:protein-tyrosine phosphatase-like protein [Trametes meyenii]